MKKLLLLSNCKETFLRILFVNRFKWLRVKVHLNKNHLFGMLSAPALRALENNGIHSIEQLAHFSEKEILAFHGMGNISPPKLQKFLVENKLSFKK